MPFNDAGRMVASIDRIKEAIGWIKVVFAIVVATDRSMIGWFLQYLERTSLSMPLVTTVGIVGMRVQALRLSRDAYRKIDRLEEL